MPAPGRRTGSRAGTCDYTFGLGAGSLPNRRLLPAENGASVLKSPPAPNGTVGADGMGRRVEISEVE